MAECRNLAKAPIIEGLIDLRIEPPDGFRARQFERLRERLANTYPQVQERRRFEGSITIAGDTDPRTSGKNELYGLFFKAADGSKVAQFRVDGFTLSRLRPYRDWTDLRSTAQELWQGFVEVVGVGNVTRVAARYINVIEVPLPVEDFAKYLTAPPTVPGNLPQDLLNFGTRVVLSIGAPASRVVLTQGLRDSEAEGHIGILLDIDVFRHIEVTLDSADIWSVLEELRQIKNQVFFKSITEETASLLE